MPTGHVVAGLVFAKKKGCGCPQGTRTHWEWPQGIMGMPTRHSGNVHEACGWPWGSSRGPLKSADLWDTIWTGSIWPTAYKHQLRMPIGQRGGRVSVHSRFPHFSRNEIQGLFSNFPRTKQHFSSTIDSLSAVMLFYNEILSNLLNTKLQYSLFIFQLYANCLLWYGVLPNLHCGKHGEMDHQ